MTPDILYIIGWTLIGLSAAGFGYAWRLDCRLRTLIPPRTEERWRQELIRDIHRYRPEFAAFEALDAAVIPIRWRRSYHTPRGAALADQFLYTMAFSAGLFVVAVSVFRGA